jgi:ABC-type antimicrobial peptide transport system permease subunit
MYLATSQHEVNNLIVVARSSLTVDQLRAPLMAVGRELSPAAPSRVGALDATIARSVTAPRFQATVIGLFAALALILAAVGIYGVAAYITSERTAEIGVRIALGAQRWQVVAGVVGRVTTTGLIGLGLGLVVAIALSRLMRSVLYQAPATDVLSFAAVAALLVLTTVAAAYIPARRASRIDPMVALRAE